MAAADNVREILCIIFCIQDAGSSYLGELGFVSLSRRQYNVYDKYENSILFYLLRFITQLECYNHSCMRKLVIAGTIIAS